MKMTMRFAKSIILAVSLVFSGASTSFAQLNSGGATAFNPLSSTVPAGAGTSMRWPLILGGSFGLGAGAGVGDGHGVGICQIKPMIGAWMPGLAFVRLGYGFSSYEEKDDDGYKSEVESSDFSVDLGVHLLSEFFVKGSYSRVSALSEKGDVAWNEWSAGFGTFWIVFSRTFLTLDIGYHWVLEHYDPFIDKDVSGGRWQMNLGFSVFVY
ncbi:hypothetical protein [Fibrobacter sp. UBA4297]|uniref:hypothetical protein n=1 Tax=Fibrobacter sp. UBA4297 TaxID=1946536 RepID=UPI0025C03EE0|nr:hypothetical protein [Fibrobacter sp. UBA4297]